jgi:hypothetical protein
MPTRELGRELNESAAHQGQHEPPAGAQRLPGSRERIVVAPATRYCVERLPGLETSVRDGDTVRGHQEHPRLDLLILDDVRDGCLRRERRLGFPRCRIEQGGLVSRQQPHDEARHVAAAP